LIIFNDLIKRHADNVKHDRSRLAIDFNRINYYAAQCIVIGPVCGFVTAGGRAVSEPYYSQCARSVRVSLSAFYIEVDEALTDLTVRDRIIVLHMAQARHLRHSSAVYR